MGDYIYIGRKFCGLDVTINFDPIEVQWLVRKEDGTILKKSNKAVPCEKEIKKFALGKT